MDHVTALISLVRRVFLLLAAVAMHFGSEAAAQTVSGRFLYVDWNVDFQVEVPRPIVGKVLIWRFGPRESETWEWRVDHTIFTDTNGAFQVSLPFLATGAVVKVEVAAENYAAVVYPFDGLQTAPFSRFAGEDQDGLWLRTNTAPEEVLDFTASFARPLSAHFNIAEAIRMGHDYALKHRDPAETEPLVPVYVWPVSQTVYNASYYDYKNGTIVLLGREAFDDFLILHEYGHFLQHQISTFVWIPALHDGCVARFLNGQIANSPEHAWIEGFAGYFAAAVGVTAPRDLLTGWGSTFTPWLLDPQPVPCPQLPPGYGTDTVEAYVAGALWDLVDLPTDLGRYESFDRLGRLDRLVFQVFDRELDNPDVPANINLLRDALLARGVPAVDLYALWQWHRLPLGFPAPAIQSIRTDGEGWVLDCSAEPGVSYQLQSKEGFRGTTWLDLGPVTTATTNSVSFRDLPGTDMRQRFYRVVRVL